jgi:hypothetical protein
MFGPLPDIVSKTQQVTLAQGLQLVWTLGMATWIDSIVEELMRFLTSSSHRLFSP